MENNAFDDALRGWMDGEELPAAAQDWQRMAARLDQHEGIAVAPAINAVRNRRYLWLLPLATAAVLCAVVFRTAFYKDGPAPATTVSIQKNAVTPTGKIAAPLLQKPVVDAAPAHWQSAVAVFPPHQKITFPIPAKQPVDPPAGNDTGMLVRKTERMTPALGNKIAGDKKLPQAYAHANLPPQAVCGNKAVLGVFGGYNIGQAKHDFTLGLVISKKLGGRVHIETNVAVVSGSYDSYRGIPQQANFPGSGISASTGAMYESAPQQLLYLQASPSVSYEVYKGLSAGGGVDAQRLLSASSAAQLVNSAGKETPQPDWDFGLTGRMDYQVAKKLRAGFVYRNSVYGRAKNGGDAARRNYLLVQLGYTIF